MHLPTLFRVGEHKLLNLFKLVDSKDTPSVLTVGPGLFAKASAQTGVFPGELVFYVYEPLAGVERADGLF